MDTVLLVGAKTILSAKTKDYEILLFYSFFVIFFGKSQSMERGNRVMRTRVKELHSLHKNKKSH